MHKQGFSKSNICSKVVSCLWLQQLHCTSSPLVQSPPPPPPLGQPGQVLQGGEASPAHQVAGNLGRWRHGHLPAEIMVAVAIIENLAHVETNSAGPGAIANRARFSPQGRVEHLACKKGILRAISNGFVNLPRVQEETTQDRQWLWIPSL